MRGQAALEYLMTYGWAILALLIVVGVILSSGIFSPSFIFSESCGFGNNMPCHDAIYFKDTTIPTITISLYNSLPYKINITDVQIISQDGVDKFTTNDPLGTVESGSNITLTFSGNKGAFSAGSIAKFYGTITYASCAQELGGGCQNTPHTITGSIVGRVIAQ